MHIAIDPLRVLVECVCGARLEFHEYNGPAREKVRRIFAAEHEACGEAQRSRLAQVADPRRPR